RLPYDVQKKLIHEAVRVIREVDPAPLSSIDRVFRGDIEIIVAKALEKERERRYQNIGDFATDIRRYLNDEPIVARPPSTWYQVSKFAKRNRAFVGAVVVILVVLVAGIVGTSVGLVRAIQARESEAEQRQLAEQRRDEAETQRAIAGAVNRFLNDDLLAAVAPEQQGRDVTMREVLDAASNSIDGRFPNKPLIEASVRMTLGKTYISLGEHAQAEPHLVQALTLRRAELGEDHPDTLASMNSLATLHKNQGRYHDARALYERALQTSLVTLGEGNPQTLELMNNLAVVHDVQGHYDEAEPLYAKTLAARRRVLGSQHKDTLVSLNNLGRLQQSMGRYAEAEDNLRETVELSKREYGQEHPFTLTVTNNLACLYKDQGRLDEAELLYVATLDARRRVLGNGHPHTLTTLDSLASLYLEQGRYQDAEPLYEETVKLSKDVLGEDHPDTVSSMNNLAALYTNMGQHAAAGEINVRTLEWSKRELGEDHPNTLKLMNNLASLYALMGRHEDAEPLFVQSLECRRRVLGHEHPDTLVSTYNLAKYYDTLGQYEQACKLFTQAVDAAKRALPKGHWHTGVFLQLQGSTLTKLKRYDEAEPALLDAYEILVAALGEEHPKVLDALNALAKHYRVQGKLDNARRYVGELIAVRKRAAERPDASPTALNKYAWLLLTCEPADMRDPRAALSAATKANEMTDGANAGILDTLALAHHRTGDASKAIEIQRQAVSILPPGESPLRSELATRLAEYEAVLRHE
ncbi:MAG: tetratricopeptide repeat protein, partial [Dehalococcoidia bacterium]